MKDDTEKDLRRSIESCKRCGKNYGNSAMGFGKTDNPLVFFVGINPWVRRHKFNDGRGITLLKQRLSEWGFEDFYFDNMIKCQMPGDFKPDSFHAYNCLVFLRQQIDWMKPKNLILFGKMVQEIVENDPVTMDLCNRNKTQVEVFPHFSSIFYPGYYTEETYYKKLKAIIEKMKRSR